MLVNQPEFAVAIENLTKIYPARKGSLAKTAIDNVNLFVPRGSFFGLLGPNGAGKSTLINILAGLVIKTSGRVSVWGHDIVQAERQARLSIGIVPQELNFDPFFTPLELLEVQAGLYGVPKSERCSMDILTAMGLADKANAYARTLSGGMRRRLLVAKALVHSPPVLILDEPTAGVDIELRQQLWAYVKKLNLAGTTIMLTTHYLEEAEALCDRIAIIDKGKLVACDETRAMLLRLDCKSLTVFLDCELTCLPEQLQSLGGTLLDSRSLRFQYKPSQTTMSDILTELHESGLPIRDISTEETNLEDIFLNLTGNQAVPD